MEPVADSTELDGLRAGDIEQVVQVQEQVEAKVAQKRARKPRAKKQPISSEVELTAAQDFLAEEEAFETGKSELYAKIKVYYDNFANELGERRLLDESASYEELQQEYTFLSCKLNSMSTSQFVRVGILSVGEAVDAVAPVLPVVKLQGFSNAIRHDVDDYERLVKLVLIKHDLANAAVEPEYALAGMFVKTLILTHAANVAAERKTVQKPAAPKAEADNARFSDL